MIKATTTALAGAALLCLSVRFYRRARFKAWLRNELREAILDVKEGRTMTMEEFWADFNATP